MNITLNRQAMPGWTLGRLIIGGTRFCFTCEDVVRDGPKVPGETAIPAGRYQVVITPSARFKRDLPLLLDVPGFSGIRIHPGNTAADTEGCILPGLGFDDAGVRLSVAAFDALFERIRAALASGEVWIDVVDGLAGG